MSTNLDAAANMLYSMEPLRKPLVQAMITAAKLPSGSRGLDVGCGLGLQTQMLAQAVGPGGQVTGIDLSPSFLELAREYAAQTDMLDRISFHPGSWDQIPFDAGTFDWVWSLDAAGYTPYEPVLTLTELARVIKPGGRLLLGYWSSQCLLPGYPVLEAHLNASPAGIAPFANDASPDQHFMRTLGWMRAAGLVDPQADTFVQTVSAPMSSDIRAALTGLFAMRWGMAEPDVPSNDWRMFQKLCQAESPEFILDRDDYYAFFTYSLFSGYVTGR